MFQSKFTLTQDKLNRALNNWAQVCMGVLDSQVAKISASNYAGFQLNFTSHVFLRFNTAVSNSVHVPLTQLISRTVLSIIQKLPSTTLISFETF